MFLPIELTTDIPCVVCDMMMMRMTRKHSVLVTCERVDLRGVTVIMYSAGDLVRCWLSDYLQVYEVTWGLIT